MAIAAQRNNIARWIGLIVVLFALATLLQYPLGNDFGIDGLLSPRTDTGVPMEGFRMAVNTATCFVLMGLSLALFTSQNRHLLDPFMTEILARASLPLGFVPKLVFHDGFESAILGEVCITSPRRAFRWLACC